MSITGSQVAPLYALSGVMRSGTGRSNGTSPRVFIAINGVQYAAGRPIDANKVVDGSLSIADILNETPNTAAFQMRGFEPNEGGDVVMTIGSINNADRLYAGLILNRAHAYVDTPDNWTAAINAIDYTWHLQRRRVSKVYTNQSASLIARDLVTFAPPGFTALNVPDGLPVIDTISFTDLDILAALVALAKRIGGYCDVDYHRDVKVFISDPSVTNPTDLTPANASPIGLSDFSFTRDLGQFITRVTVEGGGVTALAALAPGETIIPVETIAWYSALGGKVKSGSQHIAYTGLFTGNGGSVVGPGAAPSAAPVLALGAGAGLGTGTYQYAYTDITPAGESLPSPVGSIATGPLSAPLTAPTPGAATAGAGPDDGVHTYGVTFTTTAGETTRSPVSAGVTTRSVLSPASAPTLQNTAPNGFGAGWHVGDSIFITVTYFAATGETVASAHSNTIVAATSFGTVPCDIDAPSLPVSTDPVVTTKKIYVNINGTYQYAGTLANSNASRFNLAQNLVISPTASGPPASSTAFVHTTSLTAIPLGAALVTGRKLYRTAAGGSQLKLLATIADNVTTTFSDTVADSGLGANAPTINGATANQIALSAIAIGGGATTARKVYRTVVGGAQLQFLATIADNVTTTLLDSAADGTLGANAPVGDTSGLTQPTGQVNVGSTSLLTASAAPFSATGGWALLPGGQVVRYTGISGNTLTGIPASGRGALLTTAVYGGQIVAAPALIGIPSSGTGSVVYPILQGDPVNLLVTVDNLTAQAQLAALLDPTGALGDDGVVEDFLSDGTIGITEATARANAELALKSTVLVSISYKSRDKNTRAGRAVTVNFGPPTNIVGTFQIQNVAIDTFNPALLPTFTVVASSSRFSLEDLLRLARGTS